MARTRSAAGCRRWGNARDKRYISAAVQQTSGSHSPAAQHAKSQAVVLAYLRCLPSSVWLTPEDKSHRVVAQIVSPNGTISFA